MSNSEIAEIIELTGKLLDLHDQDEMRSKTYLGMIFSLERLEENLSELNVEELQKIRGIGKLMSANILEIVKTGTLKELQDLISVTPEGVFEMFKVKGIGVKKIKLLWKEIGIDNLNDLKIACENGKIAGIKGFGEKTQAAILESLQFLQEQEGKLRMNTAEELSKLIIENIRQEYPEAEEAGQVVRKCQEVDILSFLVKKDGFGGIKLTSEIFKQDLQASSPNVWRGFYGEFKINIEIEKSSTKDWVSKKIIKNSSENHLKLINDSGDSLLKNISNQTFQSEEEAYKAFGCNFIIPEMREGINEIEWSKNNDIEDLISWDKLKGTVHNHSKYSDGNHTLQQMADFCKDLGLEYFGIADHSQTAQYASGLWPETVIKQQLEIDQLNANYEGFEILKGIESDILTNGDLDYETDILKTFDYIVASVHSVLNMDKEKATQRLIRAIENPYTSILGHLSGRLLLSRKGYPLDYPKIIDACAANKVVMELNASPYRLDIDWKWINLCLEKGVWISINPDAHEMNGIYDMKYGVAVARKAGLLASQTLNAQSLEAVKKVFLKK
ncbi:MAG: DNA polymerase/3'-5' exonuclease PolX [Cytophagaceae bacterium]|nr:DNA polymerase/3'-5' exonuclease PolX [Cytophagaceae bacterium]MBL0303639.1 DNA polymerase/3'-5' exonuclease PolX [Cytophagaceae bacterium]MBL0326469.1 DNA polymerase/3'-5' exonuclease PolX [Cytophagaceae bacterium]